MAHSEAFRCMLGRPPSPEEMGWLRSVEESLAIRADDPVWGLILLMYAHQQSLRTDCRAAVEQALSAQLGTLRKLGLRSAAAQPSAAPPGGPAQAMASAARCALSSWPLTGALMVALGGLFNTIGAMLEAGGAPLWAGLTAAPLASATPLRTVARAVLGAPVGWALPLALALPAARALCWGWETARSAAKPPGQKLKGWSALVGVPAALFAWAFLVTWSL